MMDKNRSERYAVSEEEIGNVTREIARELISLPVVINKQEKYNICTLTLYTEPEDAKIRFLNIDREFENDMKLHPGLYQIEISYPGFRTEREWTYLSEGLDKTIYISLKEGFPDSDKTRTFQNIEFVYIPPGTFDMGSFSGETDELPIHQVEITKGFWMSKYEITQGQWESVMGTNPSQFTGDENRPVEMVTWFDVQDFIAKLNKKGEDKFRLPTEAEWEYACRGGRKTEYSYGEEDNSMRFFGWFSWIGEGETHPVGQKKPNSWGLCDMSGNVWEWCQDFYQKDYYAKSPTKDPRGPENGEDRVMRGGCYFNIMDYCRPASRAQNNPKYSFSFMGFRLVRSL
jgi:formylglycine-generating enzyme required for sulfatase activity